MGRKLLAAMKVEVDNLHNDFIKEGVKKILMSCDDYNAIGPASTSGKYHPAHDLGDGGLVRHTKTVCKILRRLMECVPNYDDHLEWDIQYSAAILHDFCKFTKEDGKLPSDTKRHSNEDHPRLMANMIREYSDDESFKKMAQRVECHMSRWNVLKYMEGPDLPLPRGMEDMMVAFADMISSAKWFQAEFDSNNNLL